MWRDNKVFLWGFLFFLLLCLGILMFINKGDEILFLNHHRSKAADLFFLYFTKFGEGLVLIPALLILLFQRFRYAFALPLVGLTVMIFSALFKQYFSHPRPFLFFKNNGILDQIQLIEGVVTRGGSNSFPSGHTMTAFAVFAFLAFCMPNKKGAALGLLAMAILVGISRIYLVLHFLQDVLFGAFLGVLIALAWYRLQFVIFKTQPIYNKKLNWPDKQTKA